MQEAPAAIVPIRSVLCAVDLGPQSSKTLEWAAWLARELGRHPHAAARHGCRPDPATEHSRKILEAVEEELDRLRQVRRHEGRHSHPIRRARDAICKAAQTDAQPGYW